MLKAALVSLHHYIHKTLNTHILDFRLWEQCNLLLENVVTMSCSCIVIIVICPL